MLIRVLAALPTRETPSGPAESQRLSPRDLDRQYQLPAVSVVVPTRNEADNVAELVRRLERAVPGLPMEIIFVDDSTDGRRRRSRRCEATITRRSSWFTGRRSSVATGWAGLSYADCRSPGRRWCA